MVMKNKKVQAITLRGRAGVNDTLTRGERFRAMVEEALERGLPSPRLVAFTARSGREIVRETQPGSEHERRLLRRRGARYFP